jgi:membrane protein implicated in regulation of membrane protease activity
MSSVSRGTGRYPAGMYLGLGVFAILAVVCVFAGVAAMKRRREYGDSNSDGEMGEAEFRKYEGFDK